MSLKPEIFDFALFPNYENSIEYLAETLAYPEKWDFSDSKRKNYSILKNYLEFTFRKLKREGKISYTSDNKFACFNTGLVTRNYEDIFAFFEENKSQRSNASPFFFKAFFKKSDREIIRVCCFTI